MRSGIALVLLLAPFLGCGGDDDGDSGTDDLGPVESVIVTWLLEGDCNLMTDDFLEEQALLGDTREERCDAFEDSFVEPQYTADDIKISDVEVEGSTATAVIGDDFSNVEADYTLVEDDGQWRIDSVEL